MLKFAVISCLLTGLVLTTVGAAITATSVIISDDQAEKLSTTNWDSNKALKQSLIDQSRSARCGLWIIVAGTIIQVIGTALPLFEKS